jgi:hypothetical protein
VTLSIDTGADPDGLPLTYQWKQVAGSTVQFDPTSASISFAAPGVGRQTLVFEVTVSDGAESSTSRVQVDVADRGNPATMGGGGCQAARPSGPDGGPRPDSMLILLLLVPPAGLALRLRPARRL